MLTCVELPLRAHSHLWEPNGPWCHISSDQIRCLKQQAASEQCRTLPCEGQRQGQSATEQHRGRWLPVEASSSQCAASTCDWYSQWRSSRHLGLIRTNGADRVVDVSQREREMVGSRVEISSSAGSNDTKYDLLLNWDSPLLVYKLF